jgi:hypothetical protein
VTAERDDDDRGAEREPEADRDEEQAEPVEDRESAGDDDREGERHPSRHRPPPELERERAVLAEDQEAEDEPEVRRVEQCRPRHAITYFESSATAAVPA